MQNIWKELLRKPLTGFVFLGALLTACTNVYFEKPVPQGGAELQRFPETWTGVYVSGQANQEDLSEFEQLLQQCFRMDRISDRQLLVSSEFRIHKNHLDRLKTALEDEVSKGNLLSYQLSETALICIINTEDGPEQQYTSLLKTGDWYLLPQTIKPFRQFDLVRGTQTEFEATTPGGDDEWLPEADSLESKVATLKARQKEQGFYFNTQSADDPKWSLLYVSETGRDKLTVQLSNMDNTEDFKNREAYFNAITTFRKIDSNDYLIDPTDAALDRLLAEQGLFQTFYLTKIE